MEKRKFRVTGVEACLNDSVVRGGVEEARKLATALVAKKKNAVIQDGVILSEQDIAGTHNLMEIGVIVRVIELSPVAATC